MLKHKKFLNIARLIIQLKLVKSVGFNFVFLFFTAILFSISTKTLAQTNPGSRLMNMGNNRNTPVPENDVKPKLPRIKKDTVISIIPDSLKSKDSQLETTVEYNAKDSTLLDVDGKTLHLYGEAVVTYGDIELKADYIQLNWGKNEVFAHGLPDSTKKGERVRGKPVFSQSGDDYNSDTIRYNFKSKKAIIKGIVTQQGEGFVQGKTVKKDPKDNLYLVDAIYTTCNLKEPHFHISAKKIKLVNKKSLISGPFNFVLSDIPLPIGLPFGFFPIPKKKEIGTSGIIMGNYGEEPNNRGFYFRDFGYYHAFNENIGAKVLAQVYSKGSFGVGVQSTYTKRYKYAGNLNLQYNYNKSGVLLKSEQRSTNDFNVSWSHSPQSRRPDRSFSASVNLVSNGFAQNNRRLDEVDQYTSNAFGSSVQYTRNIGKLLRTSTAFRADQNVSTKIFNSSLGYSIGLNQFNPFVKEKYQTGNWWDAFRVGLDVSGGFKVDNSIKARSTSYTDYNVVGVDNNPVTDLEQRELLRLQQLLRATVDPEERALIQKQIDKLQNPVLTDFGDIIRNGIFNTSYSVPIALPNIKIAKYINLTPSVSYRGDFFTKQLKYTFADQNTSFTDSRGRKVDILVDPNTESVSYAYDSLRNVKVLMNPNSGGVVYVDTLSKPAFAQNVSFGTGINTRVYGTYRFKGNRRLQAIRHTVAPSVNVSYTPDMASQYSQLTRVRTATENSTNTERYLPRFLNSGGGGSSEAANISFGISNQLEAKVRSKSDTAQKEFEKIPLLNNLDISGTYNLLAKPQYGEFALSNINVNANTSLFKNLINFNIGASLDPYAYELDSLVASNVAGRRNPDKFKWQVGRNSGSYLNSMNISISTRLSPETFSPEKTPQKTTGPVDPTKQAMAEFVAANPMAYVDFSIPWSVSFNYALNYNKQGFAKAQVTQTFQFQGDLSLTPKWKINFSSGWDFVYKSVTLTTFSILRELHCWDMSFNWTPIAGNALRSSTYSFTLQPRSSLLRDLKLSRRRTYYDKGGF